VIDCVGFSVSFIIPQMLLSHSFIRRLDNGLIRSRVPQRQGHTLPRESNKTD
jgi:hypothetical protein